MRQYAPQYALLGQHLVPVCAGRNDGVSTHAFELDHLSAMHWRWGEGESEAGLGHHPHPPRLSPLSSSHVPLRICILFRTGGAIKQTTRKLTCGVQSMTGPVQAEWLGRSPREPEGGASTHTSMAFSAIITGSGSMHD